MNTARKRLQWLVWGGMALTIVSIALAFVIQKVREHHAGSEWKGLVRSTDFPGKAPPVLFEVPDFALTNQFGQVVTRSNLLGHVWLADIVFTRCAGPCPKMTGRMAELQSMIPPEAAVRFVTLTTDPNHDTPAVMQSYARRFLAQPGRWHFLTGTKRQIADLAITGLKLTAMEKDADKQENLNDLFIHSTLFVLIDQQGRARATFESDDPAMNSRLIASVENLLREK
jgi:protein SCO1/2